MDFFQDRVSRTIWDPPDLCLLSSQDCRHEPPAPAVIFLKRSGVEQIITLLLIIYTSRSVNCSFTLPNCFAHFHHFINVELLQFLLHSGYKVFVGYRYCEYFLITVTCLCIFLMVSFGEEEILIVIPIYQLLYFIFYAFCDLRNPCLAWGHEDTSLYFLLKALGKISKKLWRS
jgi:hypothetical protein